MVKGEFVAQQEPLDRLRDAIAQSSVKKLDDFGQELKGKVLTVLLRVGRQTKAQEDEEKEKARKEVHARLARVWLSLGDERRAVIALAAAGLEKAGEQLLGKKGDWEAQVQLYELTGDHRKAGQLLESNGRHADAAQAYAKSGDETARVRALAKSGDEDALVRVLSTMPPKQASRMAVEYGALDAWAKVLTERRDWSSLGRLYQDHGQPEIAARAFEEAGELGHAFKEYLKAGNEEGFERTLTAVVEKRIAKNDVMGAAQAYLTAGKLDKAAEIASEKHAEQAHRWFVEGGYVDRALDLARREARKAEGHTDYESRAAWLAKAGDRISAATLWEGLGKLDRALALYEAARAWEPAARCAEELGRTNEAVELYYRANLKEDAERLKLLGTGTRS